MRRGTVVNMCFLKLCGVRPAFISMEGGKVSTSVLAPSMTSFMLMAFLPLSLPFFLFFFLNIHFLQMQKQHANTRMIATNAIETMAHDGTEKGKEFCTWCLGERKCWSKQSNISLNQDKAPLNSRFQKVIRPPDRWDIGWKTCVPAKLAQRIHNLASSWIHQELADL